jgi:hypothetical protein
VQQRKDEGSAEAIKVLPIRLIPVADLRLGLEQVLADQGEQAGWVLSGIGSLSIAPLRLAGQEELTILEGDLEFLTLAGGFPPMAPTSTSAWPIAMAWSVAAISLVAPRCAPPLQCWWP